MHLEVTFSKYKTYFFKSEFVWIVAMVTTLAKIPNTHKGDIIEV